MSEIKKVQLRGGFSDRRKIQPLNTNIQLTDFDERTRISIANLIREWYEADYFYEYREWFCEKIAKDIFNEYINDGIRAIIKYRNDDFLNDYLYLPICKSRYDEVLTMVEYITLLFSYAQRDYNKKNYRGLSFKYKEEINKLFEREYVGYRFIGGEITPISDDVEVGTICESLDIQFDGCKAHIKKAVHFLSDRNTPDYKNSIKESISAVEAICNVIIGRDNATLGDALNYMERKRNLKGQLKAAFEKLYSYTNEKGGIRHSEGLFESNVTFEEAKFMLVSCCAFVNYLIAEYGKIDEK